MSRVKNISQYDEYWILRNSMLGFSKKEISFAISNKNFNCFIGQILRKYKINNKSEQKQKHPYRYNICDEYWIIRQFLSGFNVKDISKILNITNTTIYKILHKHNFMIGRSRVNYGITEIAKELGISKQAVHQKVKLCRSPYINYNLQRKKYTKHKKEQIIRG